jgi:hypothetical protein
MSKHAQWIDSVHCEEAVVRIGRVRAGRVRLTVELYGSDQVINLTFNPARLSGLSRAIITAAEAANGEL